MFPGAVNPSDIDCSQTHTQARISISVYEFFFFMYKINTSSVTAQRFVWSSRRHASMPLDCCLIPVHRWHVNESIRLWWTFQNFQPTPIMTVILQFTVFKMIVPKSPQSWMDCLLLTKPPKISVNISLGLKYGNFTTLQYLTNKDKQAVLKTRISHTSNAILHSMLHNHLLLFCAGHFTMFSGVKFHHI